MPFKERDEKLAYMKEWRKRKMSEGYGVWLYQRRKLRFNDEVRFRAALKEISEMDVYEHPDAKFAVEIALKALEESRIAEEELGEFETP
jgi:hypothetical protein